ncbi:MAG: GH3 auxin-responsive promoter family protein [Bacteroidota bacterium]
MKKRLHRIDLFLKHPSEVQNELIMNLVQKAQYTEWGVKYDYKSIKRINEFKSRVPISRYEDLKPVFDRIYRGEENLLWPGEMNFFAKSSGTTAGKSKLIPVSKEALEDCHFQGGKDLLAMYVRSNENSKVYAGNTLVVGGSGQECEYRSNAYYGDLSAIIMSNLPLWVQARRVPSLSIALMDDWEQKIDQLAESTMNKNVSVLSGVPSWMLIMIKRILEIKGVDSIAEVWPNLELFMHGGVNFEPYRKQYNALIPKKGMNYYQTYNASEGFFSIQDDNATDDMLLMLDYGIFYEFIPLDQIHDENPKTVLLDEVEVGKNYALVISTNAGLWRYLIGDTVCFTSKSPYKIRVTGRTKHFINAFGEELIIDNAEKGLKIACEKTNAIITEYTAGPIFMSDLAGGGHEWIVEFEEKPDCLNRFVEIFDKALMELNSDYEAKRSYKGNLAQPLIHSVEKGTFYKWMKGRNKLGGQNKVPRLANDRKYVDDILMMVQKNVYA